MQKITKFPLKTDTEINNTHEIERLREENREIYSNIEMLIEENKIFRGRLDYLESQDDKNTKWKEATSAEITVLRNDLER